MTECHLILLERSENGFRARVAELPGCEVEAGAREEALRLVREAIDARTAQVSVADHAPLRGPFASL